MFLTRPTLLCRFDRTSSAISTTNTPLSLTYVVEEGNQTRVKPNAADEMATLEMVKEEERDRKTIIRSIIVLQHKLQEIRQKKQRFQQTRQKMNILITPLYARQNIAHEKTYWRIYFEENLVRTVRELKNNRREMAFEKLKRNWSEMASDEERLVLTYAVRLSDIQKNIIEMGDEREGAKIPKISYQTKDQSEKKRREMERDASQQVKPEKSGNENGKIIQQPTSWKNVQLFSLEVSQQTQGWIKGR